MKILVRGRELEIAEFKFKFEAIKDVKFDTDNSMRIQPEDFDLIFDFFTEDSPENLEAYKDFKDTIVFCNSVKTSLTEFSLYLDHNFDFKMIGFNGLPTFLKRTILEMTVLNEEDREIADKVCKYLGTEYIIVDCRVGLVTPRVICMIINEAYYTVQEGTSDKGSIDLAMKLGTNYPFGPFEWATKIGINHVYELLEALYEDTKDERYKICPLLKKEYLME